MADVKQTDLQQTFEQWKALAELQLKFIQTLGQYKAEVAKSELVLAVAAEEWALARMKATVALELESSLKRLHRFQSQTRRHVEKLDRHARAAAKIRSGEDLPASQVSLMWGAYTVFERMAPDTVIQDLTSETLHETARRGVSFADPRHGEQPCPDPPDTIENVHALLGWLKRRRFVPRRGTHAYQQVVAAFAKIASVADAQIQSLQAALLEMQQGTYETWQPVVIAALPDSVDAKKIIRLGSK